MERWARWCFGESNQANMNEKCPFSLNTKRYRFFFSTSLSQQQNTNLLSLTISYYFCCQIRRRRWEANSQEKLCHNLAMMANNCSRRRNKLYNKHIRNTVGVCNRDGMRQRLVVQGHHSWLAAAAVVAECARLLQEARSDEGRPREREEKRPLRPLRRSML